MRKLLLLTAALCLLISTGCTGWHDVNWFPCPSEAKVEARIWQRDIYWLPCFPEAKVESLCWQRAIYSALVMAGEGHKVWIVKGVLIVQDEAIPHAQAKAEINGEWYWLFVDGRKIQPAKKMKGTFLEHKVHTIDSYFKVCKQWYTVF